MLYTIPQINSLLQEKINQVYDIFKNYFGEENVDLQEVFDCTEIVQSDYTNINGQYDLSDTDIEDLKHLIAPNHPVIFVHWKELSVTNEYDKSVKIWDLYAKVRITINGTILSPTSPFFLNRSTYNVLQFDSNYLHSHVPRLDKSQLYTFLRPCLGTGPILSTAGSLHEEFDECTWMLFCDELDHYVHTESVKGVPYTKLETIGSYSNNSTCFSDFELRGNFFTYLPSLYAHELWKNMFIRFTKYYLKHGHLDFSFFNSSYTIGMTYQNYIIDISNAFVNYYNSHEDLFLSGMPTLDLFGAKVLIEATLINGKFYIKQDSTNISPLVLQDAPLGFTFKNKPVKLKILDLQKFNEQDNYITLLNINVAMVILQNILLTLNYCNSYDNTTTETTTHSTENDYFVAYK